MVMKATGIVRKIDELGRIVIPKEIRNSLKLKEGSEMEILISNDEIIFKKFSPLFELPLLLNASMEILAESYFSPILIIDHDKLLSSKNISKKTLEKCQLSQKIFDIIYEKKPAILNNELIKFEEENYSYIGIFPLEYMSEVYGGIVLLSKTEILPEEVLKAKTVAKFASILLS